MKIERYSLLKLFVSVAVLFAVLSQEPNYRNILPLDLLCSTAWMFVAVYMCIVPLRMKLHINAVFRLFVVQIAVYIILTSIKAAVYETPLLIGITDFFPIPLLVYCVAFNYSAVHPVNMEDGFQMVAWIYSFAAAVLAISCIMSSGMGLNDWMNTQIYIYGVGKNAIGQVLGAGILISFFYLNKDTKMKLILKNVFFVLMISGLVFVQCRSVLLGLVIVFALWFIFVSKLGEKKHYVVSAVVVVAIIVVLSNNQIVSIIEKSLFLDKYKGQGLNSFSSGRIHQWKEGILAFWSDPLLGNSYYVDNFYINVLANNGIIVAIFRTALFWWVAYQNITCKDTNKEFRNLIISITMLELIVSLFEAFPPYGPGVATMMFWFLSGICHFKNSYYGVEQYE